MGVADWLRKRLTGEGIPDTTPTAQRPQWMCDGMRAMEVFGYDDLRIVGLPGHQEVLWSIVGHEADVPVRQDIHALLVAEHGNPADRNAVAVWLGGHRVGRLATEDAGRLRPGLIRLQRQRDGLGVYLSYDAAAFGVRQRT